MLKIRSKIRKSVSLFLYVSIILIFVYNIIQKGEIGNHILEQLELSSSIRRRQINEVFAIIICRDSKSEMEKDNQRQMDQAYVLLKSAALLANKMLRFIILVEEDDIFDEILTRTEKWPERVKNKLNLEKGQVWYPEFINMRELFHACSTERLFLHEILPEEDSVVYLDTDTIFLKPPEDLWKEFSKFNSIQISGMTPCLNPTYNKAHKDIPHYGKTGLNAGVWMMNLTRMRSFSGGWINACINVTNEYKEHLRFGDQDIANIVFNKYPKFLYELKCQWNYRNNICNTKRPQCKGVKYTGIYLLHGCGFTFYRDHNQKLKVMFKEFLNFDVERPLKDLLQSLRTSLKNIDYSKSPSRCTKFFHFDEMLTKSLENSIQISN